MGRLDDIVNQIRTEIEDGENSIRRTQDDLVQLRAALDLLLNGVRTQPVNVPAVVPARDGATITVRSRNRRTKAEVQRVVDGVEKVLADGEPVDSGKVYDLLVSLGVAQEGRRDRELVVRYLKGQAEAGRLHRDGNVFRLTVSAPDDTDGGHLSG